MESARRLKPAPTRQPGPLLYNPALLSRDDLIASFVVRTAELEQILDQLRAAAPGHAPQHQLVLGWRGMGKTTLLHRVAYAVQDDETLSVAWLPVLFDEEQFNVGDLADFWLNALEMLSEAAGDPAIRQQTGTLPQDHGDEALEEAAFEALKETAARLGRRLVLLVDNVDLVLDRLGADREASRLREVLQHEPWLMLVGTSSRAIEATYEYDQPFYEMFKVIELEPLDEAETLRLLAGLAERYRSPQVAEVIEAHPEKVRKLKLLMGGNPRTVALLFGVLQEGPGGDLWSQLERLLDGCTSLYKDRLESLPVQAQRVFDALAQHWDPATAETLAERLRLDRGAVSGQLHRLADKGLVEKVKIPGRALGFQVRERFFNIWCLMRGGRRSRQRLRWLVSFIDLFYDAEQVRAEVERLKERLRERIEGPLAERLIEFAGVLARFIDEPEERAALYETVLATVHMAHLRLGLVQLDEVRELVLRSELPGHSVKGLLDALRACGIEDVDLTLRRIDVLVGEVHDPLSESATELLEALERHVASPAPIERAYLALGYLRFCRHHYEEALSAAERAVEMEPEDAAAWQLLGNVALAMDDVEKASRAFQEGYSLSPRDLDCRLSLMTIALLDETVYGLASFEDQSEPSFLLPASKLVAPLFVKGKGSRDRCEHWLREFLVFFHQPDYQLAAGAIALLADAHDLTQECITGAIRQGMEPAKAVAQFFALAYGLARAPEERARVDDYISTSLTSLGLFGSTRHSLVPSILFLMSGQPQLARKWIVRSLQNAQTEQESELADVLLFLAEVFAARNEAAAFTEILDEAGWGQRAAPLRDALAVLTQEDPDRFQGLAPETRALAEEILARLKQAERAGTAGSEVWEGPTPADLAARHDHYLYDDD